MLWPNNKVYGCLSFQGLEGDALAFDQFIAWIPSSSWRACGTMS